MFLLHRLHCPIFDDCGQILADVHLSVAKQTKQKEKKKKKHETVAEIMHEVTISDPASFWRWGIRWPAGFGVNTHTLCSNHLHHSRKHVLALSWSSWPHLYFCGVTVVMRGPPEAYTWMLIVGSVYGCKGKQGTRLMTHHSCKDRQHFWINHSKLLLITEVICNMTIIRILLKEL